MLPTCPGRTINLSRRLNAAPPWRPSPQSPVMEDGQPSDQYPIPPEAAGLLKEGEVFWRDLQPGLQKPGFTLRPQFRRDWVPSWNVPGHLSTFPEDRSSLLANTLSSGFFHTAYPLVGFKSSSSRTGADV
ncbi:hypothetical protein C8R47DRAFT_664093 [Mycena vitilis]|nr:hypothetical protein C8R47DRAFT_664093 [Mycena vitilis]